MKHVILVCEGMGDEALEELFGHTPLEVSKTPHIKALAKKGMLSRSSFVPHSIAAGRDVSAMSILGFNPEEFYTGLAPLEALSLGIPQSDRSVVFRCNFVTSLEGNLVDAYAGNIPSKESIILIEDLNRQLSSEKVKFFSVEGFRSLLVFSDPDMADGLDELECVSPFSFIGQKTSKSFPKGPIASKVTTLIHQANSILKEHEINKVRIDLGENPANRIWIW